MSHTEQINEELTLEIRALEKRLKLINTALKTIALSKMVFGLIVLSLLGFLFLKNHFNWGGLSLKTLGLTWVLCLSVFSILWCLHSIIDKWAFVISISPLKNLESSKASNSLYEWRMKQSSLHFYSYGGIMLMILASTVMLISGGFTENIRVSQFSAYCMIASAIFYLIMQARLYFCSLSDFD
ncbi:hypothetical protein AMD27_17055 (plasmid) [Acinetobacter sp. TGL-Y2]|uniref:hypothetical protein n=1 Tax=Acinetobacter sp. TGL-Y2 TaxID=1407071 RepID=UPI0007A66895|nr:hypothetical protein [Acinetobacter sp. TGL-Y2]AMW80626.1 hypothetical protein AMD27_17055 [Acinetobacter sp. TGL-Y2]